MANKCDVCIHKNVCAWRETEATLLNDYVKWVKEIKETYVSHCPVRFMKDPFICSEFSAKVSNPRGTADGCDTCKYEDRDTWETPCTECKYNCDESVVCMWEAKEDKNGE